MIKKGDVIIIAFMAVLCVCLFIPTFVSADTLTAQIYLDGKLKEEIDLSDITEPYTVTVGNCKIEFDKNSARFIESSCKDRLCIKHGKMSKSSDTMACVPNKVVVAVKSSKDRNDAIAY